MTKVLFCNLVFSFNNMCWRATCVGTWHCSTLGSLLSPLQGRSTWAYCTIALPGSFHSLHLFQALIFQMLLKPCCQSGVPLLGHFSSFPWFVQGLINMTSLETFLGSHTVSLLTLEIHAQSCSLHYRISASSLIRDDHLLHLPHLQSRQLRPREWKGFAQWSQQV